MADITTNVGALIPINDNNGKKAVSARDLYNFLGCTERFQSWFERQLQYGFTENVDYVGCKVFNTLANQDLQDYAMTIDMAKEVSMIQRSEKGKEARTYFIACEKKLKESQPESLSPSELILKLAQMNVDNERKMKALEEKQTRLESEIEEIKQRTTTDLHQSTIVAYVSRNNIKLDVKRYGAMGRKASTLCKKRNIAVTKINDVRWGKVNVFPDDILDEVFGMKGGLRYEN